MLPAASSYVIVWSERVLLPVGLYPPTGCFELCDNLVLMCVTTGRTLFTYRLLQVI